MSQPFFFSPCLLSPCRPAVAVPKTLHLIETSLLRPCPSQRSISLARQRTKVKDSAKVSTRRSFSLGRLSRVSAVKHAPKFEHLSQINSFVQFSTNLEKSQY